MCEVLEAVGENLHFEAERIRKQKEGATRPVLVKLRSGAVAAGIRRKTGELKKLDSFLSVFISPDRTLKQRKEHKDCVEELRRPLRDDSGKNHFIRDRW